MAGNGPLGGGTTKVPFPLEGLGDDAAIAP